MCPQIDTGQDTRQQAYSLCRYVYMFRVHVMYIPCSKLSFSTKHANWKLRLGDN